MIQTSTRDAKDMPLEDLIDQLAENIKREAKKKPDVVPKLRKLVVQANNYIASQVA